MSLGILNLWRSRKALMKMVKVLSLCLAIGFGFGCISDEQGPQSGGEELGEVEQQIGGQCSANYQCPLGEQCNFGVPHPSGLWTCTPYFVIGPTLHPCVDTAQCQVQYNPNTYCSIPPGRGYGECVF